MNAVTVLAAMATAWFAAATVRILIPPPRGLAARLRPFAGGAPKSSSHPTGFFGSVFGPMLAAAIERIGGRDSQAELALRLRHAGWGEDLAEDSRVSAFRVGQLRSIATWIGGSLGLVVVTGMVNQKGFVLVVAATVVGATRNRAAIERSITERRDRMRIEIYTINQLLAMRVRAGGGVIQAVQRVVGRGNGPVVGELAEALRLHRSGLGAQEAFRRIAASTPEPACARTYSLLAIAEERGVDLAGALLALSEDVREARRETLRRVATRRRAAMLVPTIAILAPVMLLFVGAPLPSLVLGWQ